MLKLTFLLSLIGSVAYAQSAPEYLIERRWPPAKFAVPGDSRPTAAMGEPPVLVELRPLQDGTAALQIQPGSPYDVIVTASDGSWVGLSPSEQDSLVATHPSPPSDGD